MCEYVLFECVKIEDDQSVLIFLLDPVTPGLCRIEVNDPPRKDGRI
jgi:hypothetical protein